MCIILKRFALNLGSILQHPIRIVWLGGQTEKFESSLDLTSQATTERVSVEIEWIRQPRNGALWRRNAQPGARASSCRGISAFFRAVFSRPKTYLVLKRFAAEFAVECFLVWPLNLKPFFFLLSARHGPSLFLLLNRYAIYLLPNLEYSFN